VILALTSIPKTAKASLQTECRDICNQISINARSYTNCSEINLLSISRDYYITNPCNNFGVCWTVMGNGQDCKVPLPEFIPIKNETIPTCNFENTTATRDRCNYLSAGLSIIANNNNNCTRINEYYCEAIEYTQRNCSINFGQTHVIMRNAEYCKIPENIIEKIVITNLTEELNETIIDNSSPIELIESINSSPIFIEEKVIIEPVKQISYYGNLYNEIIIGSSNLLDGLSEKILGESQTQNTSLQLIGLLNDYLTPLTLTIDNNQFKPENLNFNIATNQSNQSSIITTFLAILAFLVTKLIFINK
jgi:hypothetical protein